MLDRDELVAYVKEAGADVFGVAGIERFDELPAAKHPRAILPEVNSVIVLGRRIARGSLRGVEEGTNFVNYGCYGSTWLEDNFLSMTTFMVCEYLENHGWEAVPLPNLPPEVPPMGVAVGPGRPEPNVMLDFDDAAVRAGVGEIGYCGVVLTPEFGPRQRVQMILTEAEIAPTPLLAEPVCPGPPECKGFCPLGALGDAKVISICGKRMTIAEVDYGKCATCKNGAEPNRHHATGMPDRLAALCVRSCVHFLEETRRIGSRFHTAFQIREPWVLKS